MRLSPFISALVSTALGCSEPLPEAPEDLAGCACFPSGFGVTVEEVAKQLPVRLVGCARFRRDSAREGRQMPARFERDCTWNRDGYRFARGVPLFGKSLDAEFEFSRGHLVAMTAVFAPRPGYRLDAEAFAERLLVHLTRAYGPGHVDLDNDLWHRRYTFAAKGAEATLEVNSWESVSLRVVNESCCLFGRGPPR